MDDLTALLRALYCRLRSLLSISEAWVIFLIFSLSSGSRVFMRRVLDEDAVVGA